MVTSTLNESTTVVSSLDKKGVPGFSLRLNYLFDLACAPSETRLSWGAKKWNVVPNTVRNWIKCDIPPQSFATLDAVVAELLNDIGSKVDKTSVLGWLFAGGANPFETCLTRKTNDAVPINHILQLKIFNKLYEVGRNMGVNINALDEAKINDIISAAYSVFMDRSSLNPEYDVSDLADTLKSLAANA
jgi:hypothetical protein